MADAIRERRPRKSFPPARTKQAADRDENRAAGRATRRWTTGTRPAMIRIPVCPARSRKTISATRAARLTPDTPAGPWAARRPRAAPRAARSAAASRRKAASATWTARSARNPDVVQHTSPRRQRRDLYNPLLAPRAGRTVLILPLAVDDDGLVLELADDPFHLYLGDFVAELFLDRLLRLLVERRRPASYSRWTTRTT